MASMVSTSAAKPLSAMDESPNWLELPQELMATILQRLGAVEILNNVRNVCTTWRRICKDPDLWKVIDMHRPVDNWDSDHDAVDLSCGELIEISIEYFGSDDLLDHILLRRAVKNTPQLEKLHLSYIPTTSQDIKHIGQNCSHLTSFKLNKDSRCPCMENDDDALVIANNMHALCHLQMFSSNITNDKLQSILTNYPHLEPLGVCRCFNLNLGDNLGKLCLERIKVFKWPNDSTKNCGFHRRIHEFDDFDAMYSFV